MNFLYLIKTKIIIIVLRAIKIPTLSSFLIVLPADSDSKTLARIKPIPGGESKWFSRPKDKHEETKLL